MADAAAQKREARRRRILDNSENRLKMITGLYSNDGVKECMDGSKGSTDDTSDGSIEDKRPSPSLSATDNATFKEPVNVSNVESYLESLVPQENVPVEISWKHKSSNIESSTISSEFVSVSEPKSSVIYNLCEKARVHIIVLAVIVRILLTSPFAVLCGESAVLPLFTIESAEWIYAKLHPMESDESSSGLLGMAMMLSGIAPQKVSSLLRIFSTFNHVTQDFFIYFFVFSVTHVVLEVISSTQINEIIKSMPNYLCLLICCSEITIYGEVYSVISVLKYSSLSCFYLLFLFANHEQLEVNSTVSEAAPSLVSFEVPFRVLTYFNKEHTDQTALDYQNGRYQGMYLKKIKNYVIIYVGERTSKATGKLYPNDSSRITRIF